MKDGQFSIVWNINLIYSHIPYYSLMSGITNKMIDQSSAMMREQCDPEELERLMDELRWQIELRRAAEQALTELGIDVECCHCHEIINVQITPTNQ